MKTNGTGIDPEELMTLPKTFALICKGSHQNTLIKQSITQARKFLKLYLDAEQLCALLWCKYMWMVIMCRKFRGVQPPQL